MVDRETKSQPVKEDFKPDISPNAQVVLERRYLAPGEEPQALFRRVAKAIAEGEEPKHRKYWEDRFYQLVTSLRFLPNSPTLVNAGTGRGCLSACFVVSPEDTMDSIMQVAYDAAMIEKWGGGIGFGFSKLRPKNDRISTVQGSACGPVAAMKLYSKVGETLTQGSFRLGAHMGQLSINHPDIREFIHCKDGDDIISNFNISVQITDDFMKAVGNDEEWNLINPRNGEVAEAVKARELWSEICESAHKTGDPGVVFMDSVWETQPNPQLGWIETSNPCGEEFLENYGNCCLGSIDLSKHLSTDGADFDWEGLADTVKTAVRFLDDVIVVNTFPLEKLREVNLATRRIGLGVMGWADALLRLHLPYDSQEALKKAEEVGKFLWDKAWEESAHLAEERGPFPEYERSALKALDYPPVRNSSVLTIAPTGTISRIAGCSSGIEPHFAIAWWSNVLWKDQKGTNTRLLDAPESVSEFLEKKLGSSEKARDVLEQVANTKDSTSAQQILASYGIDPSLFRTSMTVSPEAHVRMQAVWQKYTSNSVSKTINLSNDATVSDVADAFYLAWETRCKAVTVYRDGSKSMQVLETGEKEQTKEDQERLLVPRQRPTTVKGVTERVRTGHGNLYTTINFDDDGHPFEVFTTLGKAGGCDSAQLEAISRLISLALRSGVDPVQVVEQLRGITCCPVWDNGVLVRSTPDAVSQALASTLKESLQAETMDAALPQVNGAQLGLFSRGERNGHSRASGARCPDCSGFLVHQEGCLRCLDCGYNRCE